MKVFDIARILTERAATRGPIHHAHPKQEKTRWRDRAFAMAK
jgi:hypothetical protein